jgi:cytochrome c oxidase assembly protein subunit 11
VSARQPQSPRKSPRDFIVAFACGAFVAAMVGVSYAAVPLYSWFCRTTGFGGTTQTSSRIVTVRFDSNVAPGLPWSFEPERRTIDVRLGEVVTVYYTATNESPRVTTAQAGYNVTPPTVGAYFEKINCFCFTQQILKPGEKREMAVVFYVDAKLAKDSEQNGVNDITLSYTFFPVQEPEQGVAEGNNSEKSGHI